MAKKKGKLGPKRKRMKREARLQSAKAWLKDYDGKHVIKSYSKWFGVDSICAMDELEILGLRFSGKQKKKLNDANENKIRQKQLSKARRLQKKHELEMEEYFEGFGFIAGYTEGGAPFGLTQGELEEIEKREKERENWVNSLTDLDLIWVDKLVDIEFALSSWEEENLTDFFADDEDEDMSGVFDEYYEYLVDWEADARAKQTAMEMIAENFPPGDQDLPETQGRRLLQESKCSVEVSLT